jgi:hypothetical protein
MPEGHRGAGRAGCALVSLVYPVNASRAKTDGLFDRTLIALSRAVEERSASERFGTETYRVNARVGRSKRRSPTTACNARI